MRIKQQIDEFVVPIEERSLDAYENGWKKAIELGIYNQWTAKMREALGRLNGELYPPFKEIGFDVRSQGPSRSRRSSTRRSAARTRSTPARPPRPHARPPGDAAARSSRSPTRPAPKRRQANQAPRAPR